MVKNFPSAKQRVAHDSYTLTSYFIHVQFQYHRVVISISTFLWLAETLSEACKRCCLCVPCRSNLNVKGWWLHGTNERVNGWKSTPWHQVQDRGVFRLAFWSEVPGSSQGLFLMWVELFKLFIFSCFFFMMLPCKKSHVTDVPRWEVHDAVFITKLKKQFNFVG